MSHFTTAVAVKASELRDRDPEEVIGELMAPFDENMQVEPHRVPHTDAEEKFLFNMLWDMLMQDPIELTARINREHFLDDLEFTLDDLANHNLVEAALGREGYRNLFSNGFVTFSASNETVIGNYTVKGVPQARSITPPDLQRIRAHYIRLRYLGHLLRDKSLEELKVISEDIGFVPSPGQFEAWGDEYFGGEGFGIDGDGVPYSMSTYNPNSKWDWWVIGGRWEGKTNPDGGNIITVEDAIPLLERNRASMVHLRMAQDELRSRARAYYLERAESEGNVIRVHKNHSFDINDEEEFARACEYVVSRAGSDAWAGPIEGEPTFPDSFEEGFTYSWFSFLAPGGRWLEKAEMGWWAQTSGDKQVDEWAEALLNEAKALRDQGYVLVGLDLHI